MIECPMLSSVHVRQASNSLNVVAMQAVASIDMQTQCMPVNAGNVQPLKFLFLLVTCSVCIGAGMQFHDPGRHNRGLLRVAAELDRRTMRP